VGEAEQIGDINGVVLGSPYRLESLTFGPCTVRTPVKGDARHLATLAHRRIGYDYETGHIGNTGWSERCTKDK
jgi:hypothetical protein